ncbi:uncharacterized protein BJX67DRAFT_368529 [Aspergillus lucknowensis]|uniref:Ubiquitin 3 binding protein But2 C-terminal domain-containing protein n=1 Tax=Aspergillus lucknowensis TaxID=176173 RepID=A0ABR4L5S3_9EURO
MKLSILPLLTTATLATTAALPNTLDSRQDQSQNPNPHSNPDTLIWPYRTYRWWVYDGHSKDDPQDQLLVVKDSNPRNESTALVTFDIAPELEGRKCKLILDLWDRDVSTGSQTADVFSSVSPGNRDQHHGRVVVPKPGSAEWVLAMHGMPDFECPAGELIGFEFVGVGEEVGIRWDIGATGPRVQVL